MAIYWTRFIMSIFQFAAECARKRTAAKAGRGIILWLEKSLNTSELGVDICGD